MDDQIALRPVAEHDFGMLDRFLLDPAANGEFQWFGWGDPGRWRRAWGENGLLGDDGSLLIVALGAEGIGFVAWRQVRTAPNTRCWNVGINLLPEWRGKGHGTQAQRQLTEYLFAHTTVRRLEAGTDVDNVAEQRSLEKVGFQREGVLRSHCFRGGQWHDTIMYSLLRDDAR